MAVRRWAWMAGCLGAMSLSAFAVYAWRAKEAALEPAWLMVGATGLTLILAWLWIDRRRLSEAARSRSAQQTRFALALTVAATAVAVAANMLATKHDHRWDLTSSERYALSDQAISVTSGLKEPIEVHTFFVGESPDLGTFKDLLEGLSNHTDQLQLQQHDPVLSPLTAEQFEVTNSAGTVVLQSGDKQQRLEADFGEEALINALIQLTSDKEHEICAASGHGEMDPNGPHLSAVVIQLERQNYSFSQTTLLADGGVPARCEVLLIADPEDDWPAPEREMLAAYVAGGGQVIALLNPDRAAGLSQDMARYGISVGQDIVLEANPNYRMMGGDATYLVLPAQSMADHPITQPIRTMAVMRLARSVGQAGQAIEGMTTEEILHTSEYAWAETNLDSNVQPQPDPETDRIGKIPLAAVTTIDDPKGIAVGPRSLGQQAPGEPLTEPAIDRSAGGRVLVFGDADFTAGELLGMGSNLDLLQNSIAWMVGEDDQVSIRPNPSASATLNMNEVQGIVLWFVSLIVIPGLCIGGAIATWLARRRR